MSLNLYSPPYTDMGDSDRVELNWSAGSRAVVHLANKWDIGRIPRLDTEEYYGVLIIPIELMRLLHAEAPTDPAQFLEYMKNECVDDLEKFIDISDPNDPDYFQWVISVREFIRKVVEEVDDDVRGV